MSMRILLDRRHEGMMVPASMMEEAVIEDGSCSMLRDRLTRPLPPPDAPNDRIEGLNAGADDYRPPGNRYW